MTFEVAAEALTQFKESSFKLLNILEIGHQLGNVGPGGLALSAKPDNPVIGLSGSSRDLFSTRQLAKKWCRSAPSGYFQVASLSSVFVPPKGSIANRGLI
jgi:hypothetical protein